MVQLADLVATSSALSATRSRTAKTQALAQLLTHADDVELPLVVGYLAGEARQGRIGVGWATLSGLDTPSAASPALAVGDLDAALDEISAVSGSGSASRRRELLEALFGGATADEQRFLTALLTGELRQGALEGVMLDAVALACAVPAAAVRRAFMLSGRLPATASAARTGGVEALAAVRLELGRPLRPMLASPAGSLDAALADLGTDVAVDHKLDGARIQVHRDGDVVRVWTRTLREITDSVPELVAVVLGMACRSVVLDGETLALTDDGRPRDFQDTMSRFGARTARDMLLHPRFFDCLHLDGDDLVDAPLSDRLAALDTVASEYRITSTVRPSPEQAAEVLAAALTAGHEGVMIKALDSPYAAGRRGRSWQKVKPVHTVDLVVLGAEWGSGRRRGWLSNLHLGARDPDGGPPVMVGKTFKGLSDELLAWQTTALQEIATGTEGHVVWVRPELVVEIALDGVQRSSRYPGGIALRFARVVRYRPDKDPADADSLGRLRHL